MQFNRAPADRVCKPCGPQPLVEKAASSTSVSDQQLEAAYEIILRAIGEDPSREGLRKTPARAAKAMRALTSGYSVEPSELARDALFTVEPRSEEPLGMVVVRDIRINSLCEHHLLPFYGRCHIGYLPDRAVLGLSKFARVADVCARRLQMQERLTEQIADALMEASAARGVIVAVECAHMCMCSRGVKQTETTTFTAAQRGAFAKDEALRRDFWQQVNSGTPTSRL
eukprot:jgi/Chrpa1/6120/Chrysochromulina_OHIO_Genome00000131-RA